MSVESATILAQFEAAYATQFERVGDISSTPFEPLLTAGLRMPLPALAALEPVWLRTHVRGHVSDVDIVQSTELLDLAGVIRAMPEIHAQIKRGPNWYCGQAENRFYDVYRQVTGPWQKTQKKVVVYHDEATRPIILEKSAARNSIALEAIDVAGLTVPEGALVGVSPFCTITGEFSADDVQYTTKLITDDVLEVAPLRLSAWAFQEKTKRALLAVRNLPNGERELNLEEALHFTETDIDHFRATAQKIMSMCNVARPELLQEVCTV